MRPYYYLGNQRALTQLSNGLPFFVNTMDAGITTWIILGGTWENFVDDILCALARPGDRFLDAGANLGYYTIKIANIVGPQGRVVSFEPNPELYEFLEQNVSINGFSGRCTVHRVALGSGPGQANLVFDYANMGGGTMVGAGAKPPRSVSVEVEVVAGDTRLGAGAAFDLIKFDIEGAEPFAARGLAKTLEASSHAPIIVEINPPMWCMAGSFEEQLRLFTAGRSLAFEICHDGLLEPNDLGNPQVVQHLKSRAECAYFLIMPENHWAVADMQSRCRVPT